MWGAGRVTLQVPFYVLAGGRSSRFGGDKATAPVAGRPQLLNLIAQLTGQGHPVHVVADRVDRYRDLDVPCVEDAVPGAGPLAGLVAALEHRLNHYGPGWLWLVPCDQYVWNPAWESPLLARTVRDCLVVCYGRVSQERAGGDIPPDAEAPEGTGRSLTWEPLPGMYHTLLTEVAAESLAAGPTASLRDLLSTVRVSVERSADLPTDYSFNTRSELERLIELVEQRGPRAGRQ